MPDPMRHCLRCWTSLDVPRAPHVFCHACGCLQPHLSTDVGEYFDCLECSEPLDPAARGGRSELTCRGCGARRPYVRGPMVVITGAPGVGKSVLGIRLQARLRSGLVLEPPMGAVTQRDSLTTMAVFKDLLVLGAQVAQSGRYLVLPTFARPTEFEMLPERPWLSRIHWIALVCDPSELEHRLRHRRKSRAIDQVELDGLMGINQEVRSIGRSDPSVSLLDTTASSVDDVVEAATGLIESWMR